MFSCIRSLTKGKSRLFLSMFRSTCPFLVSIDYMEAAIGLFLQNDDYDADKLNLEDCLFLPIYVMHSYILPYVDSAFVVLYYFLLLHFRILTYIYTKKHTYVCMYFVSAICFCSYLFTCADKIMMKKMNLMTMKEWKMRESWLLFN